MRTAADAAPAGPVFKAGRATIGKVVLGSGELRELRQTVDTAVYSVGNSEVTLRENDLGGVLRLIDAMIEARKAA